MNSEKIKDINEITSALELDSKTADHIIQGLISIRWLLLAIETEDEKSANLRGSAICALDTLKRQIMTEEVLKYYAEGTHIN